MVDYIGVSDIQRIVQAMGTGNFIERLAHEIEADYRRWAEFEKSPRLASHSPVGVIELMPATDGSLYSFKYVNGHPKNTARGLLTVTAFGVLAAVDTGYPLLLSELTVTTALRTAATSALAARWMARPDSRVMALIGNGSQSEFQALAFHRLVGIREVRLFDVDAQRDGQTRTQSRGNARTRGPARRASGVGDRGLPRRRHRDDRDRRQAQRRDPDAADDRGRHAPERASAAIAPARRNCMPTSCACRMRASSSSTNRNRASKAKSSRWNPDFPVTEFAQVVRGEARGRTCGDGHHDFRFGRIRARGLFGAALPAFASCRSSRSDDARSTSCRSCRSEGPVRRHAGLRRSIARRARTTRRTA